MFNHSVKVPRLYKTAAKIANDVFLGKGSVKQLVYESKHPNIKALYALVSQFFKRRNDIDNLLKKSKILSKESPLNPWLAKILITELLWGKKRLTSEAKPIKTVLAYEQIFKAHLSDDVINDEETSEGGKPRYVRVNTLSITTEEAVNWFRDEGWVLRSFSDKNDYCAFLETVSTLQQGEFMIDIHVPDLLIFPPKTQFYEHPAYKKGSIVLQDKASCLPVHILNPEPGSNVLDMCAAPGMKSTQVAAQMKNEGSVYAIELRQKRFKTLEKMIESTGSSCVKPINRDVLTLSDKECTNIDYILVDPSCSGSGLTDRVEVGQQIKDEDPQRLQKLAGFQIKVLRHALFKFPKAKRVVYSTCSVYSEENEDVVRQVLETCTGFKLVPAGPFINNCWINFGSSDFGDIGNFCLYARPDIDMTSGFFVAVFERLQEGEKNPFINVRAYKLHMDYMNKVRNTQSRIQSIIDAPNDDFEEATNAKNETETGQSDETVVKHKRKKRKSTTQVVTTIEDEDSNSGSKKKNEMSASLIDDKIKDSGNKRIKREQPDAVDQKKRKNKARIENEIVIKIEKDDKREDVNSRNDNECILENVEGDNNKKKKRKRRREDKNMELKIENIKIEDSESERIKTEKVEVQAKKKKNKTNVNDEIVIKVEKPNEESNGKNDVECIRVNEDGDSNKKKKKKHNQKDKNKELKKKNIKVEAGDEEKNKRKAVSTESEVETKKREEEKKKRRRDSKIGELLEAYLTTNENKKEKKRKD